MNIIVDRLSEDGLSKTTYRFWVHYPVVRLSKVGSSTRKTKRHGWKWQEVWDSHSSRYTSFPVIPHDVTDEALILSASELKLGDQFSSKAGA